MQVRDTTKPVISVAGDDPATVELGDYTDAGATATDNDPLYDGTVTNDSAGVDAGRSGDYTVTYTATDPSSNTATATRAVKVQDTTKPVITLTGDQNITIEKGGTYTEQGATVSDNDPAYTTTEAAVGGATVDTGSVGRYAVTYTAPADAQATSPIR